MRRTAVAAAVLGFAAFATPLSGAPLPEKTPLPDFVAFMQKAAGMAIDAVEDSGTYTGTIGNIAGFRFFEEDAEDQDIDQIVQFVLRSASRACAAFRPTGVTREDFGGTALVRISVRCLHTGVELHGEELIIADAMRYQSFSVGGPAENRERIAAIAANLFNALLAAYR
jgi:hypothetical protein